MRALLLALLALPLAGCFGGALDPFGGHGCRGSTWHGEWVEPGLHGALAPARSVEGVAITDVPPSGPRVRNATLEALWGPVALVEVAYSGGSVASATLTRDASSGPLRLAISVPNGDDPDDAAALAHVLLERIGVLPEVRERYAQRLRESFEDAPPGVDNSLSVVAFEETLDWDRLPDSLFPNGTEARDALGDQRSLREGPWRMTLETATRRVEGEAEGQHVRLEVAADDRVVAFVDLHEGEHDVEAFRRLNATIASLGAPPLALAGVTSSGMTC